MTQELFLQFPNEPKPEDEEVLEFQCPRPSCEGAPLRLTRSYSAGTGYGDEVIAQCDYCGLVIRCTTNTALHVHRAKATSCRIDNLGYDQKTSVPEPDVIFPNNPIYRVRQRAEEEAEALKASQVRCETCRTKFVPRKNAKAPLQMRFCPDCRTNGSGQQILDAEAKRARRVAGGKKAAATRAKNARKKETK